MRWRPSSEGAGTPPAPLKGIIMLETKQICLSCGLEFEDTSYCDECQKRFCPSCLKPATNPINNMEYEVCPGCMEEIQEIYENRKKAKRLDVFMENLKLCSAYIEKSHICDTTVIFEVWPEYYKAIEKIAQVRGILKGMLYEQEKS